MTQQEADRINLSRQVNRTGLPDVVADGVTPPATPPADDKPDWLFLLETQRELREQDRVQHEAQAEKDKAEISRLNGLLNAVDQGPSRSKWESRVPEITVGKLEQQLGSTRLHHGLSREQKLSALGVSPDVTDARLSQLFGGKADSAAATDLFKTNPTEYRKLREAATLLQIR